MDSLNQTVKIIVCTGGVWETVYGVLRYKPVGLPRRVLQLPLSVTYSGLMTCVARKLNASLEAGFRMTYQFPLSPPNKRKNVVVDIADDEDVEVFMDMVVKTLREAVTLFIVESGTGHQDRSNTGNNVGKRRVFTYEHLFPEHENVHVAGPSRNPDPTRVFDSEDDFGDERGFDFVGDHKGVCGNADKDVSWLMSPRAPTPKSYINVTESASCCKLEKGGECDSPSAFSSFQGDSGAGVGIGDINTSWLRPPGPPPPPPPTFAPDVTHRGADGKGVRKGIAWWMNPLPPTPAPETAPRASVSCNRGKGVDRRAGKDTFWGMPPPLLPHKVYNNKEALKLALRLKCDEEGFKIKTTRSTKDKYQVKCVSDTCDWRISATRIQYTSKFQVKSFKIQHKC